MKRLWRWLYNFAAWVSMLLCVAFMGLWVRSHYALDTLNWLGNGSVITFFSSIGSFGVIHQVGTSSAQRPFRYETESPQDILSQLHTMDGVSEFAGFAHGQIFYRSVRIVLVPTWFMVIVTAVYPAIRLRGYQREKLLKRRQQANLCLKCGYDLRATPDRCPECGTAVAPSGAV